MSTQQIWLKSVQALCYRSLHRRTSFQKSQGTSNVYIRKNVTLIDWPITYNMYVKKCFVGDFIGLEILLGQLWQFCPPPPSQEDVFFILLFFLNILILLMRSLQKSIVLVFSNCWYIISVQHIFIKMRKDCQKGVEMISVVKRRQK